MLVGKYFWVARREISETGAFIMRHEYITNKELYATNGMVHITEKGPKEHILDLERPSLESYINSAVVPPDEGVDRFRDK